MTRIKSVRRFVAVVFFALSLVSTAAAQERPGPGQSPPPPDSATEPQGFLAEPDIVRRAVIFADRNLGGSGGERGGGFYVDFGDLISGAGWIALGPGYRRWFASEKVVADTSAVLSWRGYKTVQGTLEAPALARNRLTIGTQFRWSDFGQVNFFGIGPDTLESNESEYRIRATNLTGYAAVRPVQWFSVGSKVSWVQPSIDRRSGFFRSNRPDAIEIFPADIVFSVIDQSAFVHSELSVTADTRDFPQHPLRGGVLRGAMAKFSDRDRGLFTFSRYEAEVAQFVPVVDGRIVVGVHGWLVASDADDGRFVPFYLQPNLGGHNSLRSFADYRFRDRNMLLLNAEARIAMTTHIDTAVFVDAGNVARRVSDLNLDHRSYGVGLRLHSRRQTYLRFDVAKGVEGWRFLFRLHDPFTLSRLNSRFAPIPFVH
jgi:hypothetical protein